MPVELVVAVEPVICVVAVVSVVVVKPVVPGSSYRSTCGSSIKCSSLCSFTMTRQ